MARLFFFIPFTLGGEEKVGFIRLRIPPVWWGVNRPRRGFEGMIPIKDEKSICLGVYTVISYFIDRNVGNSA